MRILVVLLLLPLLAGCFTSDEAPPGDDGIGATPATGATPALGAATPGAPDSGCSAKEVELMSWTSDENPADHEFEVAPGTTYLDLQWTPPTAAARAYRASVEDANEQVVFLEERSDGVQSGEAGVSLDGQTSNSNVQAPPPVGTYRFRFVSEGIVEGAALRAVATVCA